MADYPLPPMTEAEFLGRPHPAVIAHTAAVVERVQALKPPSLVKLDRGEQVIAAAVALYNLEIHGQGPGDEQWHKTREYLHGLTERYIEATT